jgi:hypothetical protein
MNGLKIPIFAAFLMVPALLLAGALMGEAQAQTVTYPTLTC